MIPAPARGVRILALGDSYTIGDSVDPADRWPTKLAARLRASGIATAEPVIIARTGWTADELNSGIDAAAPGEGFDLVTLLIGVNDQYRGRSTEEYRSELRRLLSRAVAFAASRPSGVIAISIPDWGVTTYARQSRRNVATIGAEIDAFNTVVRIEANRAGTRFVDVTDLSRRAARDASLIAGDGLHPSRAMYEEWATEILPVALEALRT